MKKARIALVALLALALLPGAAFAADIVFDGQGGVDLGGASQSGNTITTGDADNTISGNGSGYSIEFTDTNASVEVVGDTTVGGISATGSLTITGDDGYTLTSTVGQNLPGILVYNNLTIEGDLTVTAMGGNGSSSSGANGIATPGGSLTIDGGATVNATGGDGPAFGGYGVFSDEIVDVKNGTLSATGGTGSLGRDNAIYAESIIVNGEEQDLDDISGNNVILTTKQAEPEQAEPEAAPAPAPKPKPDLPPPIVAILYDVTKTGNTFSFKTIIANGKGNMAGATVTVQLNEKYRTTVTIGEDGIGEGTIEAPGYAYDTANFSTRPNVPGGVSVGTAYLIYSTGEVVRKN